MLQVELTLDYVKEGKLHVLGIVSVPSRFSVNSKAASNEHGQC